VFQELMPVLAQRILVLTLSRTSCDEICVTVIPRPLKAGEKDENNALTTPLSITGTPTELDQELPKQLLEFVEPTSNCRARSIARRKKWPRPPN
jgi:PRTRC genetic system protein E